MEKTTDKYAFAKVVLTKFPDGDNLYFTADHHFGHANIIKFNNRPFRDVDDMNEKLIQRWNDTVPSGGIVFHLGDFCLGSSAMAMDILERLNGRIYLILGNHDIRNIKQGWMARFEYVCQQMTIRVGDQSVILNHNPFLCYGGSYRDVWQLFGHVHSGPFSCSGLDHPRLKMLFPLQYDVGVDNNEYRPVSFAGVKAKIESQVASARAAAGLAVNGDRYSRVIFLDPSIRPVTPAQQAAFARLAAVGEVVEMPFSDAASLTEAISRHVALLQGEARFVYLGTAPYDDFRCVVVDRNTGLTEGNIDTALTILKGPA